MMTSLSRKSNLCYFLEFKGFKHLFSFLIFGIFFTCFSASAQFKKSEKVASQGKLNSKPLDSGSKAKKFEELSDFVIVDHRSTAVADIVDADPEGISILKKDMEEMFPLHTVFATSDPNVCVIGVTSPADAKTVFSKTNPKKSRIAKRDNLGKMLAEKNVKLITKEK
jgi:hypothetical protein